MTWRWNWSGSTSTTPRSPGRCNAAPRASQARPSSHDSTASRACRRADAPDHQLPGPGRGWPGQAQPGPVARQHRRSLDGHRGRSRPRSRTVAAGAAPTPSSWRTRRTSNRLMGLTGTAPGQSFPAQHTHDKRAHAGSGCGYAAAMRSPEPTGSLPCAPFSRPEARPPAYAGGGDPEHDPSQRGRRRRHGQANPGTGAAEGVIASLMPVSRAWACSGGAVRQWEPGCYGLHGAQPATRVLHCVAPFGVRRAGRPSR